MSAHVIAAVKACFAALRQIRSVRRLLTHTTLLILVHALVITEVDSCSSVFSGISRQQYCPAAICFQRRRTSRVIGEEVRAHNFTPP